MTNLTTFITGMNCAGCLIAGLFFFRFWFRTKDLFFAAFGVAFWLFALNQGMVALSGLSGDDQSWIYLLRLSGFAVIIIAIVSKNLGARAAK